jgi:competence protein ComEA
MHSDSEKRLAGTQHTGLVLAAAISLAMAAFYSGGYLRSLRMERLEWAEEKINPNTADAASLMRLPNIGPARAHAIVEYRQKADAVAFESAEDLESVRGIGPKTVEGMHPWLRFD